MAVTLQVTFIYMLHPDIHDVHADQPKTQIDVSKLPWQYAVRADAPVLATGPTTC